MNRRAFMRRAAVGAVAIAAAPSVLEQLASAPGYEKCPLGLIDVCNRATVVPIDITRGRGYAVIHSKQLVTNPIGEITAIDPVKNELTITWRS